MRRARDVLGFAGYGLVFVAIMAAQAAVMTVVAKAVWLAF